ncbi:shikimate dehydrogenase [Litoribacter ruber]|uniref:shikimate dehydrogenase family protein n=1 Tax=Litoribacter ruber TaxID=702568 RepID=UPI001BDB6530|nr:shikimate dehydrogenase [Litoribacter ruber]MBT0809737.1 shikimate dehydrogenase [Litoribacter ruber]
MREFGLIGYPLSHSFSKKYFQEKFIREGIAETTYELFELESLSEFAPLIHSHPNLEGLNVTIPYKEKVMTFLEELSDEASVIGAVNVIHKKNGRLIGHNTDHLGFQQSLVNWLGVERPAALILGTGGASKAVEFALKKLGMSYKFVSRNTGNDLLGYSYDELNRKPEILEQYRLIINTTPLGTHPNTEVMPPIPLDAVTAKHKVYDLVYNPEKTFLMRSVEARGGLSKNGLEMLQLQAEAAWKIWNQS